MHIWDTSSGNHLVQFELCFPPTSPNSGFTAHISAVARANLNPSSNRILLTWQAAQNWQICGQSSSTSYTAFQIWWQHRVVFHTLFLMPWKHFNGCTSYNPFRSLLVNSKFLKVWPKRFVRDLILSSLFAFPLTFLTLEILTHLQHFCIVPMGCYVLAAWDTSQQYCPSSPSNHVFIFIQHQTKYFLGE